MTNSSARMVMPSLWLDRSAPTMPTGGAGIIAAEVGTEWDTVVVGDNTSRSVSVVQLRSTPAYPEPSTSNGM